MGKRFITDFTVNRSDSEISGIVADFLSKEGFTSTVYRGEPVWKKGVGLAAAPQFIKVSSENGQVHLEAWLKIPILPGVYCGEMGLTGFYAIAIKKMLKSRVDLLLSVLQQGAAPIA